MADAARNRSSASPNRLRRPESNSARKWSIGKISRHASTACPWLVSAITPSELPFALQPPPSETLFPKFVQKDIVAVRYLGTVFPAYVSERVQPIAVVMVGQKFNWKPSIGAALTDSPRTLERSQQGLCFGTPDHSGIIVGNKSLAKYRHKRPMSAHFEGV